MIEHVENAIENAKKETSNIEKEALYINGMSSNKTRHLLNNLVTGRKKYLEIGTWRGSTLISAASNNQLEIAIGVDNFSQFATPHPINGMWLFCNHDTPEELKHFWQTKTPPKDELTRNLEYFKLNNIKVIDGDCFNQDIINFVKESGPFDIFFNDGDHKFESQKQTIIDYASLLSDESILIVDDWNASDVRNGTLAGISETKLQIIKQWDLFSSHNCDLDSWWNGIGIFIIRR